MRCWIAACGYIFGVTDTDLYRFGFNGKENDNEVKGTGNSMDFNDRIYDPRLGRWTSPDKLKKMQPGQSPYKAFLNNPILYQDPDGRTEFESVTFNDQRTGKSVTITRAISTDVFKSGTKVTWDAFDLQVDVSVYSDKIHHTTYTIDKKGNMQMSKVDEFGSDRTTLVGPLRNFQTVANIKVSSNDWDKSVEGNGESQAGGFVLTSSSGGVSPTKTRSLSKSEERDIGDLLTAFGALGSGAAGILGKASMGDGLSDKSKDLSQIVQDTKDVVETVGEGKEATQKSTCEACAGDTILNSEKSHHSGPFKPVKKDSEKAKTKTLN